MFTAYDVHQLQAGSSDNNKYPFGIGVENAVKELRAFADKIEKGEYILQRIEVSSAVKHDDYPMTTAHIQLYEPRRK